jgi:hypothetical protein
MPAKLPIFSPRPIYPQDPRLYMYSGSARASSPSPTPQLPGAYPNQRPSSSDSTRTPTVYTINTMSSSDPSLTNGSRPHGGTIGVSMWVDAVVPPEAVEASRVGGAPRLTSELPNAKFGSKSTDALLPYQRPWTSLHPYPNSKSPSPSQQPWRSPSPKPDDGPHIDATSEWNQDSGPENNIGHSDRFRFDAEVEVGFQVGSKSKSDAKSKYKPKYKEKQRSKRKSKGKRKGKGKDKKITPYDVASVQQPSTDARSCNDGSSLEVVEPNNAAPEGDTEVTEDAEAANDAGSDGNTAPKDDTGISENVQQGDDSGWVDDAEPYFDTNAAWDAGIGEEAESEREDEAEVYAGSSDDKGGDVGGTDASADIDTGSISTDKAKGEEIEASELAEPLLGEAGRTDPVGSDRNRPGKNSSSGSSSKEGFGPQKWPKHPTGGYKAPLYTQGVQEGEAAHVGEPEAELEYGSKFESEPELEPTSRRPPKEKLKRRSQPKLTSAKDKEKCRSKSSAPRTPTKSKSKTKPRLSPLETKTPTSSRRKSSTTSITPNTSKSKPKPKSPKTLSHPGSRSSTAPNTTSRSTSHSDKTAGISSRQQSLVPSKVEKHSTKKEPGCWDCCMM